MKCRIRGHISVGVNATLEVISVVWISEPRRTGKYRSIGNTGRTRTATIVRFIIDGER